jgi:hypothetical protein
MLVLNGGAEALLIQGAGVNSVFWDSPRETGERLHEMGVKNAPPVQCHAHVLLVYSIPRYCL